MITRIAALAKIPRHATSGELPKPASGESVSFQ
jgi:hypothetical protein